MGESWSNLINFFPKTLNIIIQVTKVKIIELLKSIKQVEHLGEFIKKLRYNDHNVLDNILKCFKFESSIYKLLNEPFQNVNIDLNDFKFTINPNHIILSVNNSIFGLDYKNVDYIVWKSKDVKCINIKEFNEIDKIIFSMCKSKCYISALLNSKHINDYLKQMIDKKLILSKEDIQ